MTAIVESVQYYAEMTAWFNVMFDEHKEAA
jgi:hypothetical protein